MIPTLLLSVLLPLAMPDLHLRCDPGVEVHVDGEPYGPCSEVERGKVVRGLDRGSHRVLLVNQKGEEIGFAVSLDRDWTEIPVSSLGWQKRTWGGAKHGDLVVRCGGPCTVDVDGKSAGSTGELLISSLTPGEHNVTATIGDKSYRSRVNIRGGMALTVRVDRSTQRIVMVDERRRSTELKVEEQTDALATAPIVADLKRALRAATPASMRYERIWVEGKWLMMYVSAPDDNLIRLFVTKIATIREVTGFDATRMRKIGNHYEATIRITLMPMQLVPPGRTERR